MLQGAYQAVIETQAREQFRGQVIRFIRQRGFDTGSAMLAVEHSSTHTEFHAIHNAPVEYAQIQDAASRLFAPQRDADAARPSLTPRELEASR